jgi:hypothetical protein
VPSHYFRFTQLNGANRQRSSLLEGLLARANARNFTADWREDAFRAIAPPSTPMPGVAAAALYADRGWVDAAWVLIATPVHYFAEMANVRLPADGILSLQQAEAEALAVDFNRVWNDAGIRLLAGRCAELFCVFGGPIEVATHDPEEVRGRHIENHLPTGADAPRLRHLMSEIEMWLFEHAVNRTRMAVAAPALNGLWLWGGGSALTKLPPVDGWTAAGHDPLFKAFEAPPGTGRALGAGAGAGAASGVVVITAEPGTDEWRDTESRWLGRSLADLRSGRISRLDLSAGDRCFSVSARWNWRPWRRPLPWWESFYEGD